MTVPETFGELGFAASVAATKPLRQLLEAKQRGNAAYREGRLQEARAAYSEALQEVDAVLAAGVPHTVLMPLVGTVFNNRAQVYMKLGDVERAMSDLTAALHNDSRNAKAWMRRATVLEGEGSCHAAVAAMERAAVLDEDGLLGAKKRLPGLTSKAAQESGTVPPLVALCGSHIANTARLQRLVQMVQSWYVQHHAVLLHISMSYSPELKREVEGLAASAPHSYPGLSIHLSSQPLSQGQHYQRLVQLLQQQGCDGKQTWLLLTDDDDLWHPRRSMLYATALQELSLADTSQLLALCCPLYIDAAADQEAASPMCVDRLLRTGAATLHRVVQQGEDSVSQAEAWCYSMRLSTLAQFFAAADPCIVSHVYWDLCLVKFLGSGHPYQVAHMGDGLLCGSWMYFYRRDGSVGPASCLVASQYRNAPVPPKCARLDQLLPGILPTISTNLTVWCAQTRPESFDVPEFAAFIAKCAGNPKLKAPLAALCGGLVSQVLSHPSCIHYKLLHSPSGATLD